MPRKRSRSKSPDNMVGDISTKRQRNSSGSSGITGVPAGRGQRVELQQSGSTVSQGGQHLHRPAIGGNRRLLTIQFIF